MARQVNERVHFRFIRMSCCGTQLCWVNPRLPNYCPECGKRSFPSVQDGIVVSDDNAHIKYGVQ